MSKLQIDGPSDPIDGHISLSGSKSISNRLLIIRALSGKNFQLSNLSTSKDTSTLDTLLSAKNCQSYDAGHAGTTFRFLCSYLALQEGEHILTGSDRMLQRPIGPLVDALRALNFSIDYIDREGYPPLRMHPKPEKIHDKVAIDGSISSQFLSSLLLISPYLPNGLKLEITGELVSKPYLLMTLQLMQKYGAEYNWLDNTIHIKPGGYVAKDIFVEGDWSSASYMYLALSLRQSGKIHIDGLSYDSIQGDAKIQDFALGLGIKTHFENNTAILIKEKGFELPPLVEFNLLEQPDLCQTLVAMCAGMGVQGIFSGLQTLAIKETDRTKALYTELKKLKVSFSPLPKQFSQKSTTQYFMLNGKIEKMEAPILIQTYEDHRMAMALAPLSNITSLIIEKPEVVNKSYPNYWNDMKVLGYSIIEL